MKRKPLPRILISLLGAAFILWAVGNITIGVLGEYTTAVVTDIRREGGERADAKPGQYTYSISYTFTLPNGNKINGFTKKIGDAVYIKADGSHKVAVRYLKAAPFVNTIEENTLLSLRQPILAGMGVILIVLINCRK